MINREGIRELTVGELDEVSGGKGVVSAVISWGLTQLAAWGATQTADAIAGNINSGNTPDYGRVDPMGSAY